MHYPMPVPAGRSTALVPHTQFLPPKRRPPRRELFEGDAAIIELRYRLTENRPGTLPALYTELPSQPPSRAVLRAALGYAGAVLIAATTAGATGFVAGHLKHGSRPVASMSPGSVQPMRPLAAAPAPAAVAKRNADPAPRGMDTDAAAARRAAELPPAPTPAVTGKRSLDPAPRMIVAEAAPTHRPGDLPLPPAQYLTDSAPKMRLGAQLMKAGDVAAARTMFERVAEAGNPDGAFALAETYDPAVLRAVPLRGGGITADTAQARRWYEKARDMGSSTAPERIVRLRVASKK